MEKLTYVVALNTAISALSADESMTAVVEKLTALRDAQVKRNSTERKPTKTQVANLELAEVVAEVLRTASTPLTITEIMAHDDRLSTLSNQKVSAIVRGMGDRVAKVVDKRVSKFTLA